MDFLQSNWTWLVFIGLFVWMLASGGGCCGSGKHGRGKRENHGRHESAADNYSR